MDVGGILQKISNLEQQIAELSKKQGGGSTSPLTTKGDLFGFDSVGNRIPIGANKTILVADSTQALGLKWQSIVDAIYPVGAIYMSVVNTSPATLFGGTWAVWGTGKVPVGVDTGQTEFNTVEKTGGAKTHTLTTAELATHNHGAGSLAAPIYTDGASVTIPNIYTAKTASYTTAPNQTGNGLNTTCTGSTANAGSGSAHNNLQPYITCFMWKRTA